MKFTGLLRFTVDIDDARMEREGIPANRQIIVARYLLTNGFIRGFGSNIMHEMEISEQGPRSKKAAQLTPAYKPTQAHLAEVFPDSPESQASDDVSEEVLKAALIAYNGAVGLSQTEKMRAAMRAAIPNLGVKV